MAAARPITKEEMMEAPLSFKEEKASSIKLLVRRLKENGLSTWSFAEQRMPSTGRELGCVAEQDLLISPRWCWATYGQSLLASLCRTCRACSLPTSLRRSGASDQSLSIRRYRAVQESDLEKKRAGLHRMPSSAVVAFWIPVISQCPLLALLRPRS
ncbi:hypothetical protein U1Q18_005768 [Sarracenia purpurea var. burkii]